MWDQERGEWTLPQVTVSKTTLSPVSSHKSMQQKKSASASTLPSSGSLGSKMGGLSPSISPRGSHSIIVEEGGEGRGGGRGGGGEELEYFKPKRALALLAEGAQLRGATNTVDAGGPWKHSRLQSLPTSHHPSSTLQHGPQSMAPHHHDVLETVERKKNKWRSLEPLGDSHKRQPPP